MARQQTFRANEELPWFVYGLPGRVRAFTTLFGLLGAICVIAYFVFVRISAYPTISGWDEGLYLQFAHNLGFHGVYATSSGGAFSRLVPAGGTGPTLIVPVAAALKLSGDSLTAARLIMSSYLLIALAGAYVLVRKISGQWAALVAIPLFLAAGYPSYNTLWMGRQVLAEVPALAFVFLGLWALCKSWCGKDRWLIAGSLLVAGAIITKNQLIWTLGPSFALLGIVDRVYYRQLRWKHSLAPLAGVICGYMSWFLVSLWIAGPTDGAIYLDDQTALTSAIFLHIGPHRWLENARYLGTRIDLSLLIVCAFGYGLFRSRERSLQGLQHLILPLFGGVVLLAFILLSLPWPRYIYPVFVFAALCAAVLAVDVVQRMSSRWRAPSFGRVAVLLIVVVVLAGPALGRSASQIAVTNDQSAKEFAALIDRQVPKDASVLNWEFDVEFYTQKAFLHPPAILFAALIDETYNHRHTTILDQRRIPQGTEYVVVGPFAKQTGVFQPELMSGGYRLVASIDSFELYRLGG